MASILFYLFSAITVISALKVITSRNPFFAVLFLILAFFNVAGLFVLLGAELVAMMLIIVYVGAVAVLFLFVVMMLDLRVSKLKDSLLSYLPLGTFVAVTLFLECAFVLYASYKNPAFTTLLEQPESVSDAPTNTHAIGQVLYTEYFVLFQSAGLILLVAMIGAIVLTHRQRDGVRKQNISQQLQRSVDDTIEMVNVESGKGVE